MISIWYFIGLLILIYGVLIAGAGIADWIAPAAQPTALADLHMAVWWGAMMIVLGGVYAYIFRPGRGRQA